MSAQPLEPERGTTPAPTAAEEEAERRLTARIPGIGVYFSGSANVIMQLAWPEVGYGVVESTVHSGQVQRHPLKRFRTTVGYLGIAMWGPDDLREDYRRAVNRQHRQVRSGPDSPVRYNAFDPELQLWVASCLYYGARDIYRFMYGPLSAVEEELLLRACSRFATTLQVPAEMWHRDRAAFEQYWERGLQRVRVDPPVREHLRDIHFLGFLPRPLGALLGPPVAWLNTGFLPQEFRDAVGLRWSERDDRRFRRLMRLLGRITRLLPGPLRRMPVNHMVTAIKIRRRLRMRLV